MKQAVVKSYGKKGQKVVEANWAAIDGAIAGLHEVKVPADWANATTGAALPEATDSEYFESFVRPIVEQKGNTLPVSVFNPSGIVPTGTTQYEKRGIAVNIPAWDATKCIQCNQCAFVCPHAAIRPVLVAEDTEVPANFATKAAIGVKGAKFRMQVSPLDCTGCGSCANVCPAKEKALTMVPAEAQTAIEEPNYKFSQTVEQVESGLNPATV